MRRFQHLAGIERMEIGIVVLHANGDLLQDIGNRIDVELGREAWQPGETRFQFLEGGAQYVQFGRVDHEAGPLGTGRELTVKTAVPA